MTFLLHGLTLTLGWFFAVNAILSALIVWIARREPRSDSPAFWFRLRLMPAAAATLFAAIVFVPSYWQFEPRDAVEGFDIILTAFALGAVAMLAAAAARGATAWSSARRRTRRWMQTSRPSDPRSSRLRAASASAGRAIPVFAIDADAPILALVGVLRPRLLATRGLIEALTEEELAASVAHEIGHSRTWDNFKRLAMRAAPDLLASTEVARAIERRWAAAAERVADGMSGNATPASRCALASALVKVARLMPRDPLLAEPISTLIGDGGIAARVHDLLDDRPAAAASRSSRAPWIASAVAVAIVVAGYAPLLRAVHDVTEVLVHALP